MLYLWGNPRPLKADLNMGLPDNIAFWHWSLTTTLTIEIDFGAQCCCLNLLLPKKSSIATNKIKCHVAIALICQHSTSIVRLKSDTASWHSSFWQQRAILTNHLYPLNITSDCQHRAMIAMCKSNIASLKSISRLAMKNASSS